MKLALVFSLISFYCAFAQVTQTFTTSGSFTVPTACGGVTSLSIECWGGGGGGAGDGNTGASTGGGGGGGGYSVGVIAVVPGEIIPFTVGGGGAAGAHTSGAGGAGGATTFLTVSANGGAGGQPTNGAGGAGGTGNAGNGMPGSSGANNASGSGGAGAGSGGNGGLSRTVDADGMAGAAPGGGGSGGNCTANPRNSGGAGGSGMISITYTFTPTIGCGPCAAIPITTFPYTYSGNTTTSSNDMTGGCWGNFAGTTGGANDDFFTITVGADSYYSMSLTATDPTMIIDIAVLSAPSCSGPFTCMSDGSWAGGLQTSVLGSGTSSADSPCRSVRFTTAGTYYIKIDADAGDNGPYTLNVDQYVPTALPSGGDGCANAAGLSDGIPLDVSMNNCNSTTATDDPLNTLICAGSLENTTWMEFQSDGGGSPVTVSVTGVTCTPGYAANVGPPVGVGYYGASGQFGIFTSSTDACGGTYTQADPNGCQSIATAATYATTLPNATPTTYFLVMDGNGGAECDFTMEVTNVIALPAELVSFRGRQEIENNELLWEVAAESNLSYYSLESSANGADFKSIANIPAVGNSSENLFYSFSDFEYHLPRSFYRLKMVDYDGQEKYSNSVVMDRTSELVGIEVLIYPNPSEGLYSFDSFLSEDQTVSYKVLTSLGQVVYNQEYELIKGKNSMQVDLSNLADGIYYVEVSSETEKKTIQLIKQ